MGNWGELGGKTRKLPDFGNTLQSGTKSCCKRVETLLALGWADSFTNHWLPTELTRN